MSVGVSLPLFGLLSNVAAFHRVREIGVKRFHPQDIYTMILLNVFEGDHLHHDQPWSTLPRTSAASL